MREENEARARAAEEKKAAAEARRAAARRRRLAPSGEEFTVRLVRGLDGDGAEGGDPVARGGSERSRLVGTTILVDSLHPDFQSRWRQTRQGAAKVDERLCGYLATIVSSHYRERAYQAAERQRVDHAPAYLTRTVAITSHHNHNHDPDPGRLRAGIRGDDRHVLPARGRAEERAAAAHQGDERAAAAAAR